MRKVQLTNGYNVIVSDSDYPLLSQFKWRAQIFKFNHGKSQRVYAVRHKYNKEKQNNDKVYLHREVMGLVKGDRVIVDHINNNSLDCRRENMRIVTQSQNCCNRPRRKDCRSKFKGVSQLSENCFRIQVKAGKTKIIKYYRTEVDAAIAYNEVASVLHGEYALLNEVPRG